jgi:divalent metal cation (Fe/Co/Zn/Cd) transporter
VTWVRLLVAGLLVKASLQNVVKPLQSLLDYSPVPHESLHRAVAEAFRDLPPSLSLRQTLVRIESGKSIAVVRLGFPPDTTFGTVDQVKQDLRDRLVGQLGDISRVEVEAEMDVQLKKVLR